MLLLTLDADVRFRHSPYWCAVMKSLEQGIGVRVEYVGLQPRVLGIVVVAIVS